MSRLPAGIRYAAVGLIALFAPCSIMAAERDVPLLDISVAVMPPGVHADGSGYVSQILEHLFARTNRQLNLMVAPPRRSQFDANEGLVDGVVVPYPDIRSEFPQLRVVTEALFPVEISGMYVDESIAIRTLEDFHDYRLAYLRGWKRAEALFADHEQVEIVRTPRLLLEMLVNDRVDVIFFSTVPARHLAQVMQAEFPELGNLRSSEYRLRRYLYLHLHQRHESLLPELTQALIEMKADGTMSELLVDYGLDF